MKKLVAILALAMALVIASAVPAFAAVRVKASTKTHVTNGNPAKVVFTAKVTRRGHARRGTVRVKVYRNGHLVRTITAKRSGSVYKATWGLSASASRLAAEGAYRYKVQARTKRSGRGSTTGRVVVPVVAPVVEPAPTAPTAPATDTVTQPTTGPATPTTTVVPPVVPAPTAPTSRWIGYYIPGAPAEVEPLNDLQSQVGTRAAVVNFFISDWESFPTSRVQTVQANGSIPMITLEFVKTVKSGGVDSILNGERDEYLTDFATAAKRNGGEVWLRPFHEMNGDWSVWCGVVGNNTTAKTVAAWKYVHDKLYAEGATNIKFVWNVNGTSVPNTSANAIEKYWPGDAYVDYTSIDGYNFGNHASWSSWASPESIFGDAYRRINALTNKPMFIAETACTSNGGNKAAWMADFFSKMGTRFPKIQGVCWFNADKEEDWRIEETAETLAVMQNLAKTGY